MKIDTTECKNHELVNRRKEQILAAAKHFFALNGYSCTRMDEISDYLKLGKGTIYRYFDDKKELFLAVFENGMRQLQEKMQTNVDSILSPKEKIAALVKNYFEFFDNDRDLIEIYMQVRSEFKDEFGQFCKDSYSTYIGKVQENLHKGIEIGMFRAGMDVEKTAEVLTSTLQGILQSFYTRVLRNERNADEKAVQSPNDGSLCKRTDAVTALLLEGLMKRG